MGGKVYGPLSGWYHASKYALEGLSNCLRVEVKQFGINVVIVEPGGIETEFGNVISESFMDRSVGGAYVPLAQKLDDIMRQSGSKIRGSHPKVIAEVVPKAIRKKRPKIRYVAGAYAKPMLFIVRYYDRDRYKKEIMIQIKIS